MQKRQLFLWVAALGFYTGLGMVLGFVLSDQAQTAPAYIGALLILLGAILLGMYISSTREPRPEDTSSSGASADPPRQPVNQTGPTDK